MNDQKRWKSRLPWAAWVSAGLVAGCSGELMGPTQMRAGPGDESGPVDRPIESVGGGTETGGMDGLPEVIEPEQEPTPVRAEALQAPIRRITPLQYRNAVLDLFDGVVVPGFFDDAALGRAGSGYSTDPAANVSTERGVEQLMVAAEDAAFQVVDQLDALLPCAAEPSASVDCMNDFLQRYGVRAFGRDLLSEEQQIFTNLFEEAEGQGASFAEAMEGVVAALLQMPPFLYVVEVGATEDGDRMTLTDAELAQRMSLLILDSIPDAALLEAARAGELQDADTREAQARRLLAQADASLKTRWVWEWLHLDEALDKDPDAFPDFDQALERSMQEELARAFSAALEQGGTLAQWLRFEQGPVNQTLAAFYGIQDFQPGPDGWALAPLPERHQGLLARPFFLSSHASATASSHVERGYTVLKQLLCVPTGSIPADAMSLVPEYPANSTARQKSAVLRQLDECALCHNMMDPIGLAFENYDAIGRWRDQAPEAEGRQTIDPSGTISDLGGLAFTDLAGASFAGPAELTELLANSQTVQECIPRQWFRYATGRRERNQDDFDLIDEMQAAFQESQGAFDELVVSYVRSDAFRVRRLAEEDGR